MKLNILQYYVKQARKNSLLLGVFTLLLNIKSDKGKIKK